MTDFNVAQLIVAVALFGIAAWAVWFRRSTVGPSFPIERPAPLDGLDCDERAAAWAKRKGGG